MIKKKRLPKAIKPCPIYEAIIELRFDSNYPPDAVYGVLYQKFTDSFSNKSNLPILQLPEEIRLKEPSLFYKPYYQLSEGNYLLQIGPRVISFIIQNDYSSWEDFSTRFNECFEKTKEIGLYKTIKRIGVRYQNFFELNIFDKSDFIVELSGDSIKQQNLLLTTNFESERFNCKFQVSNNSERRKDNKVLKGSIIDIDASYENEAIEVDQVKALVDEGHNEEKTLFFSSLKQDFINNDLNAEYE